MTHDALSAFPDSRTARSLAVPREPRGGSTALQIDGSSVRPTIVTHTGPGRQTIRSAATKPAWRPRRNNGPA